MSCTGGFPKDSLYLGGQLHRIASPLRDGRAMTEIVQQGTRFPGPPIGSHLVDTLPGRHIVQFYDDDQILAAAVADFLAKGLEAREALLVVATPGHVEMIEDTLSHRGLDLAGARASG